MIPVDQTTFGHPGGNCFSACVASLLDLPIACVPYFMDESDGRPKWHEQLDAWLAAKGYYALHFNIQDREAYDRENLWPKGHYILSGRSPRGDHAVVAKGRDVVHDPHPSRDALIDVEGFTLLVPLFAATVKPYCDHEGIGKPGCVTCDPLHEQHQEIRREIDEGRL